MPIEKTLNEKSGSSRKISKKSCPFFKDGKKVAVEEIWVFSSMLCKLLKFVLNRIEHNLALIARSRMRKITCCKPRK